VTSLQQPQPIKKPDWLKVKFPSEQNFFYLSSILKKENLNTICRSAKCPNISECWSQKTATFLILGDTCTRHCAFCAVKKGIPSPPSPDEPSRIAEAVSLLGLRYGVITSVTRDDLSDGGASIFAQTIRAIKERMPDVRVEVLIPDFGGNEQAVATVVRSRPDIVNHNLETTESMYPKIKRPKKNYEQSLKVLQKAKELGAFTKSGLMVGLGEKEQEIVHAFFDLRRVSCDLLTIGQYLQPSKTNAPVRKFYTPYEFERLRRLALNSGFRDVESGPLVRSSYKAHRMYESSQEDETRRKKCDI